MDQKSYEIFATTTINYLTWTSTISLAVLPAISWFLGRCLLDRKLKKPKNLFFLLIPSIVYFGWFGYVAYKFTKLRDIILFGKDETFLQKWYDGYVDYIIFGWLLAAIVTLIITILLVHKGGYKNE